MELILPLAASFLAGGIAFGAAAVLLYRAGLRKGIETANILWRMAHDEQPVPDDDEEEPDQNFPTEA